MSTEEQKAENSSNSDMKVEPSAPVDAAASPPANVDAAVAWPPPEAAPEDGATAEKAATPADSGVMTAPEPSPTAKSAEKTADVDKAETPEMPAATPQEEMGLSNSTLHWLEDGDQAVPGRLTEPGSMPSYDPRAPVPGRKRAVLVVGVAGAVALFIAGTLYFQAQKKHADEAPAATAVEPARDITTRAEAALAANRLDEAMELAHLALSADQRFADAHFVVASVQQAHHQNGAARDEFRKYLELAPLGTHAAEARTALSTLPP
jgi:hypothetical protein